MSDNTMPAIQVCYDVDYYTFKEWTEQACLWYDDEVESSKQWIEGVIIKKDVTKPSIDGIDTELKQYDIKLNDGMIVRKVCTFLSYASTRLLSLLPH